LVDADVCGHIFALADPGELTLTPLKVVNKPGRYEITNGHPRSADSDASQDSVKALRERLEGLLTIDPEATISQEPLPAEIELALQRISGGGDLLWLDSLLRELPGILPVPEEPMQYHSLEEQNWHAIPDTRTMRGKLVSRDRRRRGRDQGEDRDPGPSEDDERGAPGEPDLAQGFSPGRGLQHARERGVRALSGHAVPARLGRHVQELVVC
jgi:hypothetical protein